MPLRAQPLSSYGLLWGPPKESFSCTEADETARGLAPWGATFGAGFGPAFIVRDTGEAVVAIGLSETTVTRRALRHVGLALGARASSSSGSS